MVKNHQLIFIINNYLSINNHAFFDTNSLTCLK
jgi:hypothetical protein